MLVLGVRVVLQRCDHETEKNSGIMKALVRANPSYSTSALSSLLGLKDKDDNCEYDHRCTSRKHRKGNLSVTSVSYNSSDIAVV